MAPSCSSLHFVSLFFFFFFFARCLPRNVHFSLTNASKSPTGNHRPRPSGQPPRKFPVPIHLRVAVSSGGGHDTMELIGSGLKWLATPGRRVAAAAGLALMSPLRFFLQHGCVTVPQNNISAPLLHDYFNVATLCRVSSKLHTVASLSSSRGGGNMPRKPE
ncbi:hypothetical protein I7I50_04609 [Histoplasma capsulatum G186AR]|uniref:Secreted protein n=1 Tax=Ajellomyces capsulatus TaxID=5037 RepID=A0A8H8CY45_AJECA|nr:hypothetical protein I7I52_05518 [Histoplasma capsulatum]QSS75469.1 hypothetical protein I7I50_04609 [Histoplasma capsulatum G186AR]